jgi:hypothetical protein
MHSPRWRGDWRAGASVLSAAGFASAGLVARLDRIRRGQPLQLPAISRQRVGALVPQLLHVASTPGSVAVADLFEHQLPRGGEPAQRLCALDEHPPMLPRLAQLMGASWAADT